MASKTVYSDDSRLNELISDYKISDIAKIVGRNVLLGHADDEGIRLNNGRAGSALAPDLIRAEFKKLTPGRADFPQIADVGNLTYQGTLAERQNQALETVKSVYLNNHRLLALGGGHDHAFSDVGGFLESFSKKKPIVINLDAHLDLRPLIKSPTSGTPFYQLIERYRPFDFYEIGIQQHSSSLAHLDYAKTNKVKVYTFLQSHGHLRTIFNGLIKLAKNRPVFLSLDIDAFSSAYAPGASAASPIGLDPNEFLKIMPQVASKLNIQGLGIYEVSPPLDVDSKTSKLAAIFMHSFLLHAKK
ncbi:MAG: formimidoylglutamase [Bdellovibrionales bacterium]|nr:formimidoylglutamase [Bdellovibrionales bacterium]